MYYHRKPLTERARFELTNRVHGCLILSQVVLPNSPISPLMVLAEAVGFGPTNHGSAWLPAYKAGALGRYATPPICEWWEWELY